MISDSYDGERLNEARREIADLTETIAELQRRIDKQAVLMRAFFSLFSEQVAVSEAQLLQRFRDLELEKSNTPAKRCWQCGRTINLRHNKCYYCGELHRVRSAFELLDAGAWPDVPQESSRRPPPSPEHGITATNGGDSGITILPGD